MDFNQNKNELLKHISQQKQAQAINRRSAAAQSRIKDKMMGGNLVEIRAKSEEEKTNKPSVIVFGLKSLFLSTLKSILQQYCNIFEFDDVEKAGEFLLENKVPIAVMDMDPPNDVGAGQNFFDSGKTINPDMQYIVYQKDTNYNESIQILERQGAVILKKPIDRLELVDLLKKFTAKWREENVGKQG